MKDDVRTTLEACIMGNTKRMRENKPERGWELAHLVCAAAAGNTSALYLLLHQTRDWFSTRQIQAALYAAEYCAQFTAYGYIKAAIDVRHGPAWLQENPLSDEDKKVVATTVSGFVAEFAAELGSD